MYPVYGTQWHPEKNPYEWTNNEPIPHTADAVAVAQYMANFFVGEARKCKHLYPFDRLMADAIWNTPVVYTYKTEGSDFIQKYYWPLTHSQ